MTCYQGDGRYVTLERALPLLIYFFWHYCLDPPPLLHELQGVSSSHLVWEKAGGSQNCCRSSRAQCYLKVVSLLWCYPACFRFPSGFSGAPRCFFSLTVLCRLLAAQAASLLTFLGLFFALRGGGHGPGDQLGGSGATEAVFNVTTVFPISVLQCREKRDVG